MKLKTSYTYIGDRFTDPLYKNKECTAVRSEHGKCIRGKNANMLVSFGNLKVVVLARLIGAGTGCDELLEDDTDEEEAMLDYEIEQMKQNAEWIRKAKNAMRIIHGIET